MRSNIWKSNDGEYHISDGRKVNGGRQPRMHTKALTDCVCYNADGQVIKRIARTSATSRKSRPRVTQVSHSNVNRDRDLMSKMGTIHEQS